MTIVYEVHDVRRFERVQQFASYARLVKCQEEDPMRIKRLQLTAAVGGVPRGQPSGGRSGGRLASALRSVVRWCTRGRS